MYFIECTFVSGCAMHSANDEEQNEYADILYGTSQSLYSEGGTLGIFNGL